jgi:hypothetical protein
MRTASRFTAAMALLLPLASVSCSYESHPLTPQPVPAALTKQQAATLAAQYLSENAMPTTGLFVAAERQPDGWWLYYKTAFDASARPPSLCYLIRVHNDGTVEPIH